MIPSGKQRFYLIQPGIDLFCDIWFDDSVAFFKSSNYQLLFLIFSLLTLISLFVLFFYTQYSVQPIPLYIEEDAGKRAIPLVTNEARSETTSAKWVWIKVQSVTQVDGIYRINGYLGAENSRPLAVILGKDGDKFGLAESNKISFNAEYPIQFPSWSVAVVSEKILQSIPSGSWVIAKIETELPKVEGECGSSCQEYLASLAQYLDVNKQISAVKHSDSWSNQIIIGPADQILVAQDSVSTDSQ